MDDFSCYRDVEDGDLIWHYAGAGFENILRTKTIWLSDAAFLNDWAEMAWVFDGAKAGTRVQAGSPARGPAADGAMRRKRDAYQAIYDPGNLPDIYVGSFSQFGDSLSQWRDYAGRYGAALDFDRASLEQLARGSAVSFCECIYGRDRADFPDAYNSLFRMGLRLLNPKLSEQRPDLIPIYLKAAKIKHVGFRPEAEVRAVFVPALPGGDRLRIEQHRSEGRLVRHVSFPWTVDGLCALKKIRLAPAPGPDRQGLADKAAQMAARHGVGVPIWSSDIPYRWQGDRVPLRVCHYPPGG